MVKRRRVLAFVVLEARSDDGRDCVVMDWEGVDVWCWRELNWARWYDGGECVGVCLAER